MDKIVIYGVGDFAKTLSSYIETECAYEIIAYVVDEQHLSENITIFNSKPLIGMASYLKSESYKSSKILFAIGYSNMRARKDVFEKIISTGKEIAGFLSSKAIIHDSVKFGVGNIVLPNTVIEPNVVIGDNNIFWSSVNVAHDTEIGSHCFLASQTLLGGFCSVKDGCFLGFNSTILQNINLSEESLIGACSLITRDTVTYGKYVGQPARLISMHKSEGIKV